MLAYLVGLRDDERIVVRSGRSAVACSVLIGRVTRFALDDLFVVDQNTVGNERELLSKRPRARRRGIGALAELPWMAVIVIVAATFAFRTGMPAFRHDWIWVSAPSDLVHWFVDNGLSEWNPHGLGNAGQIATFNLVLAPLALLGACGWPPEAVLFTLLVAIFGAAYAGVVRAISSFKIDLDPIAARSLGLAYALGPIAFQKTVAGHIFWLAAFAALPWFVASVRRGCTNEPTADREFAAAALLFAVSSTQIQFVAFDFFVLVVVIASSARSWMPWFGGAFVVAIGLFHNANAVLAPLRSSDGFFLERAHATLDWERGMSSAPVELARLSGYVGYDTAALSSVSLALFEVGEASLVVAAIVGIAVARDRRALAFATIAVAAVAFASGWNGPLSRLLDWAMFHLPTFTIFRELFHVMALYAFAAIMLAAMALARLGRRARFIALPIAVLLTLPFTTLGLDRLVPAIVALPSERDRGAGDGRLHALLPDQEPISAPGLASGGGDPARFVSDDAASGDMPLVLRSILDGSLPERDQRTLLAELGIERVAWRAERVSALARTFEPHVGATYAAFDDRQGRAQRRFTPARFVPLARSTISLERVDRTSPLRTFLADDVVPPGRSVGIVSSYYGNDIDRQWVSGRLWSWFAPQALGVLADPIFTKSAVPLVLALDARPSDTVYVLAASHTVSLDGVAGERIALSRGPYAWYRWRLKRSVASGALRTTGLTSLARCIVSRSPRWAPPAHSRLAADVPTTVPSVQRFPWSLSAMLPRSARDRRLVFARSYSPGWHLMLDGRDLGSASRVDGVFNGWIVPPGPDGRVAGLSYAPQRRSGILIAIDVLLEATLLAFVFVPFRRTH